MKAMVALFCGPVLIRFGVADFPSFPVDYLASSKFKLLHVLFKVDRDKHLKAPYPWAQRDVTQVGGEARAIQPSNVLLQS